MDKCIGIASRNIKEGEYITLVLNNGDVSSPDLIIDPEFDALDFMALIFFTQKPE